MWAAWRCSWIVCAPKSASPIPTRIWTGTSLVRMSGKSLWPCFFTTTRQYARSTRTTTLAASAPVSKNAGVSFAWSPKFFCASHHTIGAPTSSAVITGTPTTMITMAFR